MPKKTAKRIASQNGSLRTENQNGPGLVATPANVSSGPSPNFGGTVLVFSKDEILADRLRRMLEAKNLEFCWYAAGATRLAVAPVAGAACVVLDLTFEEGNELACFEQVKANGCGLPVIVLAAAQLDIRQAVQLMRAGATDILIEPMGTNEFLTAIDRALEQSRAVLQRRVLPEELLPQLALLTAREREVINLILAGLLNKQIAEQLHLALVTVKAHRGHAMRKLGARNAAELARIALGTDLFGSD